MLSSQLQSTKVQWIPAHPSYGSVSMERYATLLASQVRDSDPFSPYLLVDPYAVRKPLLQRQFQRRIGYPIRIASKRDARIVHVLDHSWADMLKFAPKDSLKVVTVHDLIPLRFPGELDAKQADRFKSWVSHIAEADAIISDSIYTKSEVEELLQIDGKKIHVVPLGVSLPVHSPEICGIPELVPHREVPDQFRIGSIGSTLQRKNLEILPEALGRLKNLTQRKIVLVRVGNMLPNILAKRIRAELGDDGLVELGRLSDEMIPNYYEELDALVVPSLYEGFGLPVIEGMAARLPVVASRATSLPEVGGDISFYFDPHDPEELANILAEISDQGVSETRLDQGYNRAKEMSWRKCLDSVYDIYNTILNK